MSIVNDWQADHEKRCAAFNEKLTQIAKAGFPGWQVNNHGCDWSGSISESVQAFYVSKRKDKLEISGVYPQAKNGCCSSGIVARPSISVSADRDPAAIAADIKRRFMPQYLEAWKEAQALVAQADHNEAQKNEVLKMLCGLFNETTRIHDKNRLSFLASASNVHCEIDVFAWGKRMNLRINGDADNLKPVLEALAEIKRDRK